MRKLTIFILSLVAFIISFMEYINLQISYKYEVDEAIIMIKIQNDLTPEKKKIELEKILEHEMSILLGSKICQGVMGFSLVVMLVVMGLQIKKTRFENVDSNKIVS